MAPVIFVVDMGVHCLGGLEKIKEEVIGQIPGVVEVPASLVTGHVAIVAMGDTATLKLLLETKLNTPAILIADFGAAPAPPVRGSYHPYVGYIQLRYPTPAPQAVCHTLFGDSPSDDEEAVRRGLVVFGVNMDVHTQVGLNTIKDDIVQISGVIEICASLVTGHVAIIAMTEAATLKTLLETRLSKPAFLIVDFGATPAPPVGGGYGMVSPWSHAPRSAFPAPMVGGGYNPYGPLQPQPPVGAHGIYNPYASYRQPCYPAPPLQAYYTPFDGRPWGPPSHYTPYVAPANPLEDDIFEDEHRKGCCCSIQ